MNNKMVMYYPAKGFARNLKNDWRINESVTLYQTIQIPVFVFKILKGICEILGWKIIAQNLNIISKQPSGADYIEALSKLDKFKNDLAMKMKDGGYDCMLLPMGVTPPILNNTGGDMGILQSLIMFPNVMGLCCGVVHVKNVEKFEEDYVVAKEDIITKKIRKCLKGSTGLPIGVQVCALKNCEESCIRLMKELENSC